MSHYFTVCILWLYISMDVKSHHNGEITILV